MALIIHRAPKAQTVRKRSGIKDCMVVNQISGLTN